MMAVQAVTPLKLRPISVVLRAAKFRNATIFIPDLVRTVKYRSWRVVSSMVDIIFCFFGEKEFRL
jgi:hypothetical protein